MIEYLMLLIGLFLLVKGADFLIDASSSLAKKYGVSTLFIGLTVLAFGTSLPELIVNLISAFKDSGEIAFGNIIGSNMSNILLVLGLTSLFVTIKVADSTIKKEIPYSIFAVLLLIVFSGMIFIFGINNGVLSLLEGFILLLCFVFFMQYVILMAKKDKKTLDIEVEIKKMSNFKLSFFLIAGILALFFGGKWTVDGAIIVARNFGMSEFFISATIVAIGTSLPELITSIIAAFKKEIDLLVGNIIGSNIFNILWVLGLTSIIKPILIPEGIIIDLFILTFVSVLLLFFVWRYKSLNKYHGMVFILLYILYIFYLIFR